MGYIKQFDSILDQIKQVAGDTSTVKKVVLFGSRARGDHRPSSDYDIAIYPMRLPFADELLFRDALDELNTLHKIDLLIVDEHTDAELLQNIEREGVVLLERISKQENFQKAVRRLQEALAEYAATPSDTMRDGVIQRFEFTTELAWKACREHLLNMGYAETNGPKPVMREALSAGMIADDTTWIGMLNDRNLTSHIYKESVADEIFQRIGSRYIGHFESLSRYFIEYR